MKTISILFSVILLIGCASQKSNVDEKMVFTTSPAQINTALEIEITAGKSHNHPTFAIWIEDADGNYIETLYATQYIAKGIFGHGEIAPGKWSNEPGEVRRPAAVPYWAHKRNIKAEDGLYVPSPETAVPDALTGATPKSSFTLKTGTKLKSGQKFNVLVEINQPWDSNNYWTNNKFPEDKDYQTSLQPAIIYAATVEPNSSEGEYILKPIGHSHHSGKTGELFTDLTTLTTAKDIVQKIVVRIK